MEKTYRLKPMVVARLFAEITVLLLLLALPAILLVRGEFWKITIHTRIIAFMLSIGSLILLPAYGYVTYLVRTTGDGIYTHSLFDKQFLDWGRLVSLRLKTVWGSRRYVLTSDENVEFSFSIWLMNISELVEEIRSRLPNRGRTVFNGVREFHQSISSTVIQVGKLLLGAAFIAAFWLFFRNLTLADVHAVPSNPEDKLIVLGACLVFSAIVLFRIIVTALMPKKVIVTDDGLELQTIFFKRSLPWLSIRRASQPFFLLPEGLLLRLQKGFFLIGDHLEGFDELQEDGLKHVTQARASAGSGGAAEQ